MNMFHDISVGKKAPEEINIVVENCKGTSNKIEYNIEEGVFKLDRVFYSPMYWPFDYGFIPRTWSEDDDPVDVVVLTSQPTLQGCVLTARPIGVMIMEDERGRDDKIIAVPVDDPRFNQIKELKNLSEHMLKEIQEFFETYKRLEPNKWVKFKEWKNSSEAKKTIKKAMGSYSKKFKKN